jgi:hypothetical protein
MYGIKLLQRIGIDILKGAASALAAIMGMVIGGMITSLLHMPTPVMPAQASMAKLLPLMFLSETIMAIVLGECFHNLYANYWKRLLGLWLCNYLIYFLLTTLDGMLYTPITNANTSFVSNLFPALFLAAVVAGMWTPDKDSTAGEKRRKNLFALRKPGSWAWRVGLAWMAFPLIYYLIGRIAAIFTVHYYQDSSLNLGTVLPSIGTILVMQVLRGAFFLLAVVPIIFSWRNSLRSLIPLLGAVIFIQIAATPILQGYWLPLGMRLPHALELLVDSYLQAITYAVLLFVPSVST